MEIKFKRDTAFRKQFFVLDSFAHPAKMDAQLLIWIVERYTQVGETILDPMAGSGTMMLACGLGRNCILVELEDKFCKMMRDNWEEVRMRPQLGCSMGECQIIQGDARQLEGLLVDKIVTSPPYAEAQSGGGIAKKGYQGSKHSPTDLVGKRSYMPENIGDSENQIGNLPYGQIDSIVTSPPYEASVSDNKESPLAGGNEKKYGRWKDGSARRISYTQNEPVDSIITSPPYEGSNTTGRPDTYNGSHGPYSQVQLSDYRQSKDNIGNLKSDSYLSAMLQVYQSCHHILRPQGLMILVTKNFIRNKQVIRLDTDTIKLCEQVGFTYLEGHERKLSSQSFWRIIYHQKHPEVEQIEAEDVLVFSKYQKNIRG